MLFSEDMVGIFYLLLLLSIFRSDRFLIFYCVDDMCGGNSIECSIVFVVDGFVLGSDSFEDSVCLMLLMLLVGYWFSFLVYGSGLLNV